MRKLANILTILLLVGAPVSASALPLTTAASVGELQAQPGAGAVQLLSYYAGNNKGGGLFAWVAGSSATPDGCVIFGGTGGRWVRQLPGALDVTMCGAYWDGAHDDAAALN